MGWAGDGDGLGREGTACRTLEKPVQLGLQMAAWFCMCDCCMNVAWGNRRFAVVRMENTVINK